MYRDQEKRRDLSKVSVDELREELDLAIKQKLQAAIENMDGITEKYVSRHVDQIIALTFGLSDRWGHLEIDHCNGRKTELANEVGRMAFAHFNKLIPGWIEKNIKQGVPKGWVKAMRDEYKGEYSRAINNRARDLARERAWADAESFLEAALTKNGVAQLDLGTDE